MNYDYDRVDSDGYPMTMNDLWREREAQEYRARQEAKKEGHIPYASDRCECQHCKEVRDERYAQMDDAF